eukprot:4591030-Pyramimonas_sp.AAC.1
MGGNDWSPIPRTQAPSLEHPLASYEHGIRLSNGGMNMKIIVSVPINVVVVIVMAVLMMDGGSSSSSN